MSEAIRMETSDRDKFVPAASRAAIAEALRERAHTEIHLHDADHAFFRAELDNEASRASFRMACQFLNAALARAHAR